MQWTELRRAAISLGSLLVVYLIYAKVVVPLIEPPAPQRMHDGVRVGSPVVSATDRYQADLQGLFEPGAWENESPKILCNRNTLLLFKDYQPQEDGTLRVFPCTAVIVGDRSSDESRRASSLILQAPDGAVLQLSRPVDMRGTQFGQPVAGFLLGKIRIHSHGQPDGTGRLEILTSDVQIKPQMILTPHDVEFQYERSHAQGRDLMIKLMPLVDNRKVDTNQGWAGVRSIELMHLKHLHLEIADPSHRDDSSSETTTAPVDVDCQGPLRVDFTENLVTLEEHVELRRQAAEGVVDTLQCQKLSLHLTQPPSAPPEASEQVVTEAGGSRRVPSVDPNLPESNTTRLASLPKLEIGKVIAEGDPVVLDAPSRRAHIRSRRMLYDLQLGRFQLWANPDHSADQVYFRYDQHQVTSRTIDCVLEAEGRVDRLTATGPGQFAGQLTGANPQPVRASWLDQLEFVREGDLHRLTLDQGAEVQVGASYGIEAEVLHVWLEPAPPSADADTSPANTSPLRMSVRPQRLVALANAARPSSRPVRLRSEGVVATTQQLEARFEHRSADRATARSPATVRIASAPRVPSTNASSPTAPPRVPLRETRVFGRSLNAVLRVMEHDVTVDNLVLQDDVRVQQVGLQDPTRPLFDLHADAVRMQDPTAQQLHVLTAVGHPVSINSEQMQLQTLELNLDQARNLVWTQQPGRMIVLVDRDANGQSLTTPQEMTIDWSRDMQFDGLDARFGGGVEVRSADQRLRGGTLHVQLTRKLGFGNSSSSEPVDIRQVRAEGNVLIETREYDQQRLMSIAYLQVPFAQIDRQSGDLRAGGPGRVITVREGFRGNLTPVAAPRQGSSITLAPMQRRSCRSIISAKLLAMSIARSWILPIVFR